jgi:hypothetical protein
MGEVRTLKAKVSVVRLRYEISGGLCAQSGWKSTGFSNLGLKLLGCESGGKPNLTVHGFRCVVEIHGIYDCDYPFFPDR